MNCFLENSNFPFSNLYLRIYQWKKFCKSRIIDRYNVINIPVCEIKAHDPSYLLQTFEETPTQMSIKINRLDEGHNSYPLVCRRPAETVSLQRRQYVIDEELQYTDHLFLGVACFSFLNLKIKKDRHNLTIKEEKDLNFVILLKRNPKNYLRQVLFHLKL